MRKARGSSSPRLTRSHKAVQAQGFPQAGLSNGVLQVKLYLPDPQKGYYRATRFDWSGMIESLTYGGHNYFGPFYEKFDPDLVDVDTGTVVAAGPCSAATGPVEEFLGSDDAALGYAEAKPGETFIKIGVGVLEKPREAGYSSYARYKIVDPGKWTIKKGADWIEYTQVVSSDSGYAYVYRKKVRLSKRKPEMTLEHSLKNTGRKVIATNVYDHNFLVMDGQPPGPDFMITFPFDVRRTQDLKGPAELRGKQLVFLKQLGNDEFVFTPIPGFGPSAQDYDIRVENHKTGAGVRIRGNRPISRLMFWSIRTVLCPEPFISMKIEPGQEHEWNLTYEFYTLSKTASD